MKLKKIHEITDHRPWSVPERKWSYYQEWNDVVFLHWQVDSNILRSCVPIELDIDLYEGNAWVSLVAFTMENVRFRYLPSFSPISDFHEINIRTYVRYKGKTGVYFLSIEAANRISTSLAKTFSGLPYRFSKMNRKDSYFHSINNEFNDKFEIGYESRESAEKDEMDLFLTEKYALFLDKGENILTFDIHHKVWPLQSIVINELSLKYDRFSKLFSGLPDRYHYSSGVQVLAWKGITS